MNDPRRQAQERLGGRYEVRVLEPSPPALEGNHDDPTARGEVPDGRLLVSPVSDGDLTWDQIAVEQPELAEWIADHWLGAWKRLGPVPERLAETREALHRLAEGVVSPARREGTGGEISLRCTHGGYGTPFYGEDAQVRVDGAELVVVEDGRERREAIESLHQCAELAGLDATGLDETPLEIDATAAAFIGDWFGYTTVLIAELRAGAGDALEPATINLWPEHFDIATELGAESRGRRAGYGGSPGDAEHHEPYLYVAPWEAPPEDELW
ncbi:MAG: hypothetical protein ACR2N5_05180, partial [Solirubrobacterales bacterium]